MKVSILVPVYGVEQYIEHCAVSLFEQTYDDLEYIFVDDCTPDRSMEILQEVMERYPKRKEQSIIIRHDRNKGLGAARLTALQKATGDNVMFVDSDDYLPKDATTLLVKKMMESDADIIDGAYCNIIGEETGSPIRPYHDATETYLKLMLCHNIVEHHIWARLYRRFIFFERQILPIEKIDYCEDYQVVTRFMLYAKRAVTDNVVYFYNEDNLNSYTHNLSEKNLQSFRKANEIVSEFFHQNDPKGKYRTAVRIGLLNVKRTILKSRQQASTPFWSALYLICKRLYHSYLNITE